MSADLTPDPGQAPQQLDPIYTAACQFGMRGLRIFPTEFHGHRPMFSEWQHKATNDVVWIDRWFQDRHVNLALCCGMQPNGWTLLLIDIDPQNGGRDTFDALNAEFGWDVGGVPTHLTPSGGRHLFYLVPEELCISGTNVLGPGIDTRGGRSNNEGCGYGMLPQSIRPSKVTGELVAYGAQPGRGLLDLDPPEAPEWLLDMLRLYLTPKTPPKPPKQPYETDDNPWDWTRANVAWEDKLVEHGWTQKGPYWARPGKTPREGTGAYLHEDGRFAFWTQTDLPPSMVALGSPNTDGSYSISLADFITAYEFGGDRRRFGQEYRVKMPPPPSPVGQQAAKAEPDSSEDMIDTSWFTPVDLTGVLDGTEVQATPSILRRTDGVGLFYPGTINGIHGESGLGKGWVAVTACAEVIKGGQVAVYVDLEDTPTSIANRLLHVGLTKDQVRDYLIYIRPQDRTSPVAITRLVDLCRAKEVALVIIDSLGEAFGLDSINEDKDAEVGPWLRQVPRALANTGACVLIVDHVTKSVENPLYPKGSARKRAAVGGAAYLVEAMSPMTKGKGGKLRLTCAKDRYGYHARGKVTAEMVFSSSGPDDMLVTIFGVGEVDKATDEQERHERQITEKALVMMQVARSVRTPWGKTELCRKVGGNTKTVYAAFDHLTRQGLLITADQGKTWSPTS